MNTVKLADAQYEWNPIYHGPDGRSCLTRGLTAPGAVIVYSRSECHEAFRNGHRLHPELSLWGCVARHHKLDRWQQLACLFIDFHTMVVRDGIDPQAAHREFLKIDEYRQFISPDCEGAE